MSEVTSPNPTEAQGPELARRGRLLVARDRYVLVFALIMLTIAFNAFLGDRGIGVAVLAIALAVTVAVTVVTSDARRVTRWFASGLSVLTLLAAVLAGVYGVTPWLRHSYKAGVLGMTLVLVLVIGRRIISHPVVNLNTLAGAASIYLLLGLLFALSYSFIGGFLTEFMGVGRNPAEAFFVAARNVKPSDFMYFSFVTLTTVGYGDLTASTDIGRMLAVVEALVGQLYLVTVVAVLVSNIGQRRTSAV